MSLRLHRRAIIARGIYGIVLLAVLLSLPYLFSGSLAPDDAKRMIRDYLLWKLSQQQLAELKNSGGQAPDTKMALRWKEQSDRIHKLQFVSIEVKRALLVPPVRRRTCFVVRLVIGDANLQNQTRYFWFSDVVSFFDVRESSKLAWYLPI